MSDARAKELLDLGERLYSARMPLLTLFQEIAENFYPERGDFTGPHSLGAEFSDHLMDSYPVLMRRELGNSISAMLRPRDRPWFKSTTLIDEIDDDEECASYLEYMTSVIRRSIYDPRSKFIRATKEGDHDFIAFGQCVISVEEAPNRDHLYFRGHHLRDCVWLENEIGEIDHLHRKDAMNVRSMLRRFGDKMLHESVKRACEKEPGKTVNMRAIVMPSDEYDYVNKERKAQGKKRAPFSVVYIDADNCKVLREGGLPEFPYVVPRWHTIQGSQYAFSPATTIALPDGRLAQNIARILLESGEKAVDPPMIATDEAVREVNLQAGGLSWVDLTYDERLGEALRPIKIDPDMRTGLQLRQDIREMLTKAFFLDKLTLPPAEKSDMTAYEVGRRLEEFVRSALPLFEPMEIEYNTRLLDKAFTLLNNMQRFDWAQAPDALRGAEFTFHFESPIQAASNRTLVSQFGEVMQLVGQAAQMGVAAPVNIETALTAAIRGTGAPARWRKSKEQMDAEAAKAAADAQAQRLMTEVGQGADVAQKVGDAAAAVRDGLAQPDDQGKMVSLAQQMGVAPKAGRPAPPEQAQRAA